jgi:hypothetical protein
MRCTLHHAQITFHDVNRIMHRSPCTMYIASCTDRHARCTSHLMVEHQAGQADHVICALSHLRAVPVGAADAERQRGRAHVTCLSQNCTPDSIRIIVVLWNEDRSCRMPARTGPCRLPTKKPNSYLEYMTDRIDQDGPMSLAYHKSQTQI